MQAHYPRKYSQVYWDTLNVNYPVRNNPKTPVSSETIARKWTAPPEVLQEKLKEQNKDIREYSRDYSTCNGLRQSQSSLDYGFKISNINRFNKHTSCGENKYVYPPCKRLADQPPACNAHGTTVMKESYTPINVRRDKVQFMHPATLERDPLPMESSSHKELDMDTTHEGYEKYLDPYLTTSRLHHRPYTTEQLNKISNSKDVVTYYTLADIPWVRSTKPKHDEYSLGVKVPKSMFDKEKFKGDFREIRTHNRLHWVPGSFRTEVKDNYTLFEPQLEYRIDKYEEEVRTEYLRSIAKLETNIPYEDLSIRRIYASENSQIGSKKPICAVFEQCVEKNKRLLRKDAHAK